MNLNSQPKIIRAVVVDDHISVACMVGNYLRMGKRHAVVREAASGRVGLLACREYKPDLLITALALREMSGPEMMQAIREELPDVRMLVYSGTSNRELLIAGLEARPHGFVHKIESLAILHRAIEMVSQGESFFSPFATRVLKGMRPTRTTDRLTPQERTVLQLVGEGLSSKQVAGKMCLSPKTVENYRARVMRKIGLHDIASLTRYAIGHGIVQVEPFAAVGA